MSQWQPIETAPKDGTPILVWMRGSYVVVKYYIPKEPVTMDYGYPWHPPEGGFAYRSDQPELWQRLPPPPTPVEEKKP